MDLETANFMFSVLKNCRKSFEAVIFVMKLAFCNWSSDITVAVISNDQPNLEPNGCPFGSKW